MINLAIVEFEGFTPKKDEQPEVIDPKTGKPYDLTNPEFPVITGHKFRTRYWAMPKTPAFLLMYLEERYDYFNKTRFNGKLDKAKLVLLKDVNAKSMRLRGLWTPLKNTISISPNLFNAPHEGWVNRILLHEMCLTGDSLVNTEKGLVRIDEIELKSCKYVQTTTGKCKIEKWWKSGVKPTIIVQTDKGRQLKATDNHRVLVVRPHGTDWVRMDEIRIGDFLVAKLGSIAKSEYRFKYTPSYSAINQKETPAFPQKVTKELARLLGYLTAEGSFLEGHNPNTVHFSNTNDDVLKDYLSCWEECFGYAPEISKTSINAHRKDIADFLVYIGFTRAISYERRVPWCILQASPDLVAEFLKAYIEGDGSLSSKRIEAVSSSVGLLRDIQLLMQSLGIASTIEEKTKSTWAVKQPYTLRTDTDINNIYKIGVVSKQRQVYLEKWEKFFNRPRVTPIRIGKTYRTHPVTKDTSLDLGYERVTALTRGKTEAVYDMRTAKAHFVANGLVVHNCHKEVTDFHGGEREEAGHGPKWRACMIKVGLHRLGTT